MRARTSGVPKVTTAMARRAIISGPARLRMDACPLNVPPGADGRLEGRRVHALGDLLCLVAQPEPLVHDEQLVVLHAVADHLHAERPHRDLRLPADPAGGARVEEGAVAGAAEVGLVHPRI